MTAEKALYDRDRYLKELSDIALGAKTFLITNSKGDDIEAYPDMGDRLKALDLIIKITSPAEDFIQDVEPFRVELVVLNE